MWTTCKLDFPRTRNYSKPSRKVPILTWRRPILDCKVFSLISQALAYIEECQILLEKCPIWGENNVHVQTARTSWGKVRMRVGPFFRPAPSAVHSYCIAEWLAQPLEWWRIFCVHPVHPVFSPMETSPASLLNQRCFKTTVNGAIRVCAVHLTMFQKCGNAWKDDAVIETEASPKKVSIKNFHPTPHRKGLTLF